jgi:hypothetical protein
MAKTNQQQQDQDNADFAAQFNADDVTKPEQTEDEAFGLAPDKADAPDAGGAGGDAAGGTDADAQAAAPGADKAAAEEQRLREWEDKLKQQQKELDARAAETQTTNADEKQTSTAPGGNADGGGGDNEEAEAADPAKALAEDFGPEFVVLLEKFIEQVCKKHVGAGLSGVQETVQSVIEHLNNQGQQEHFKAIKTAHADFQEVIASPEFMSYKAAQAPAEQAEIDRVVASGSAQEIIDMLTKFKQSADAGDGGANDGADQHAMDAAEGVRSSGLRLPPKQAAGGSFEDSWNEH